MLELKLGIVFTIFLFSYGLGLDYNKQRYHNTDFLQHEAGNNNNNNFKKESNLPSQIDYGTTKSQFPPLSTPSFSQNSAPSLNTRTTIPTSKRDYVASDFPTLRPPANLQPNSQKPFSTSSPVLNPTPNSQISGKRDYVAPNKLHSNVITSSTSSKPPQLSQSTQPSSKRDYVNPKITDQSQQGKVKDLINFYDKKTSDPPLPQKGSYSSIVQGAHHNNEGVTVKPPITPSPPFKSPTQKPFSFSSIVSGSHRQTISSSVSTTNKPLTTPHKPTSPTHSPTTRPLVLPSSIVQNTNAQGNIANGVSDIELQTLSEDLLRKDTNNAAKYVTINYQGKTTSQSVADQAPLPLLSVSSEAWNIPTIQKFVPLLDNYDRDTHVNEYVTPLEKNEENAFMDSIVSTGVIRHLMLFLKEKGFVTPDPKQQRDFLKQLWFNLYARSKGKLSSSGFEHSFVSELHNGGVSGLHNWIYFTKEEQANRLNYLGYLKHTDLNGKGAVIKLHFNHQGVDKPVDSIFVGTSPELEIALYTLCFITRVDTDCNIKLAGKDIVIKTYKFRYRSKNYVGSAFPQI